MIWFDRSYLQSTAHSIAGGVQGALKGSSGQAAEHNQLQLRERSFQTALELKAQ